MAFSRVYSRTSAAVVSPLITVEVDLANGLPCFAIVGLPETAVKESRDRVRAAIKNAGFDFPVKRITVNLAPADLPKEGARFDLAIAIGILSASGQLPAETLDKVEFLGELSLAGELRPVKGVLPSALATRKSERSLVVPTQNAAEASLIDGLTVYSADKLDTVVGHCHGQNLPVFHRTEPNTKKVLPDLSDVKGQFVARRALEVAAAGNHHLLMVGPPGTGKTLLARRMVSILPEMTEREAIEAAVLASLSHQGFQADSLGQRPMREPHHSCSGVALVGGGAKVLPGEVSLAHLGVLFLDELTEFNRSALEVLREPLEVGEITLSRAAKQATYPAQFLLVAAMNACPQGRTCDFASHCECGPALRKKHLQKLSAPLLDRIDLQIHVPSISGEDLASLPPGEGSNTVKERVSLARDSQIARQGCANHHLSPKQVDQHCALTQADQVLLNKAVEHFGLSARVFHRLLKVARTIADLDSSERIKTPHITEALSYRALDRVR